MSEKEKKNAPQEEQPQANTTPETEQAAEKAAEEETFTVTREQMEQMEQLAKDSGSQFLLGYVQMLVDAANLRSVVRVLRMGRDSDFLTTVLFPGGTIPAATVVKAADGEPLESIYFSSLFEEAAAAGVQAIQGGSLTAFEKACDNAVNAYMQKAKYIPFGEQPMLGYVSAKDNEFTAIRIILTGRLADLPADVIRERLRNAYV